MVILSDPEPHVLIVSGDIFKWDSKPKEMESFCDWLREQPFAYKVVIAGNHDRLIVESEIKLEVMFAHVVDAIYLRDELVTIEEMRFYGTPWTSGVGGAFQMERDAERSRVWNRIPKDVDVLITHSAPKGVLDGGNKGDKTLREHLLGRSIKPKLHVFGHIHSGYGTHKGRGKLKGTTFINGALTDDSHRLVRKPITIEL